MQINGILLVNKERGMSSNTVVNKVKKILQAEKAGHLGTLDVLGEGLLPVTLGKGTKLFDYFLKKDKTYLTVFKFGQTTSTLDLEGDIIAQNDVVTAGASRVFRPFHQLRKKSVAHIRDYHSNCIGAACNQTDRKLIGLVIHSVRGANHEPAGLFRNSMIFTV